MEKKGPKQLPPLPVPGNTSTTARAYECAEHLNSLTWRSRNRNNLERSGSNATLGPRRWSYLTERTPAAEPNGKRPGRIMGFCRRVIGDKSLLLSILAMVFIIGIGVAVAVVTARVVRSVEVAQFQNQLAFGCSSQSAKIQEPIAKSLVSVRSFVSMLTVLPNATSEEFELFYNVTGANSDAYVLVGYAPALTQNQRAQWEQTYGDIVEFNSSSGSTVIREPNSSSGMYYPLQYAQPPATLPDIGFDFYSMPQMVAAIQRAIQTGHEAVSFISSFFGSNATYFVPFFPVYPNNVTFDPVEQNPVNLSQVNCTGFVMCIVNTYEAIVQTNFSSGFDINMMIRVTDDFTNLTFYESESDPGNYDWSDTVSDILNVTPWRQWTFTCAPSNDALNSFLSPVGPILAVVIVIAAVLFGISVGHLSHRNLQARRRARANEEKLEENERALDELLINSKAILRAISDPLVSVSKTGHILGANNVALEGIGITREAFNQYAGQLHLSQIMSTVTPAGLADRPAAYKPNEHAADDSEADGSSVKYTETDMAIYNSGRREVLIRRVDGSTFIAEAQVSERMVTADHFAQIILFHDVTQKKQAELELLQAKESAELANIAKAECLYFLCHEVRNPVHCIVGLVNDLMSTSRTEDERADLDGIYTSALFLSCVVNDALDLNEHQKHGNIVVRKHVFNPTRLSHEVIKMEKMIASSKGIRLHSMIDSLPHHVVGDNVRLTRALTCVLEHSMNMTPAGGTVSLMVTLVDSVKLQESANMSDQVVEHHALPTMIPEDDEKPTAAAGEKDLEAKLVDAVIIRFAVIDNGTGLSPAEVDARFEPFAAQNASVGPSFGTHGLGMALSRAIIELLGGTLHLHSRVGVGCRAWFDLVFPVSREKDAKPGELSSLLAAPSSRDMRNDTQSRSRNSTSDGISASESTVINTDASTQETNMDMDLREIELHKSMTKTMLIADLQNRNAYPYIIDSTIASQNSAESPDPTGLVAEKNPFFENFISLAASAQAQAQAQTPASTSAPTTSTPVSVSEDAKLPVDKSKTAPNPKDSAQPATLPRRVLVVEDNAICQRVTCKMLTRAGFEAVVAADGLQAIRTYDTETREGRGFCAVLMDLVMPVMSGYEATAALRQSGCVVPIIAVTANSREDKEKCEKYGMDAYLSKPLQPKDLVDTLVGLVGK